MTFTIAAFGTSLIAIILMLATRVIEIKRNKKFISQSTISLTDKLFIGTGRILKKSLVATGHLIAHLLHVIRVALQRAMLWILDVMHRIIARMSDMIKGKFFLKKRGPASFYLKDVADHKSKLDREI